MAEAESTCTVDSCDRPVTNKTHQMCAAHYKRVWRTGSPQAHIPLSPPRKTPEPAQDFPDGTRICQDCDARLPLTSFHNDAKAPGGKRKTCKACRVERETDRYNANPEFAKKRMRDYRQDNLMHVRAREAAYYEKHREQAISIAVANSHIRRARMAGRPYDRGVTTRALRKRDGDRCYYCAVPMIFKSFKKGDRPRAQATLEHIQAISRGGAHTWDNCVLACWGCNISKGARPYTLMERPA